MKKTKLFSIVLAVVMIVSAVCILAACNNGPALDDTILKEQVAEGQKMTFDQLLEKAKEETGEFVAYGNTSRISDAMKNFNEKYGAKLGVTGKASKLSDSEIYKKLDTESTSANKNANASVVLIQDSANLINYRNTKPLLTNYIPMGMDKLVDANNLLPLAHQFINKLFMYNKVDANDTCAFTNVWQLTQADYKGKIFFKSPVDETVNMNFLIMLTSDEWSGKLEKAYKALNNNKAAEDVGKGKAYDNYGYKWIAEFLSNCNFSITSDTTIAQKLSTTDNKGKMGLFVLSKLRDSSVYGDNLQVSAWDKKDANGENVPSNFVKIDPFAGFMYSIYAQLASNGPRPYTAMLFVNYLMTEDGFTPWKSLGGYSANNSVPIYTGKLSTPKTTTLEGAIVEKDGETVKYVYADNNKKEMVLTSIDKVNGTTIKTYTYLNEAGTALTTETITDKQADGSKTQLGGKDFEAKVVKGADASAVTDQPLSFWRENLVVEDGEYILSVMGEVKDWINAKLSGK